MGDHLKLMWAEEKRTTKVIAQFMGELARLRAENEDLKAALEVWNSDGLGRMIAELRAENERLREAIVDIRSYAYGRLMEFNLPPAPSREE